MTHQYFPPRANRKQKALNKRKKKGFKRRAAPKRSYEGYRVEHADGPQPWSKPR